MFPRTIVVMAVAPLRMFSPPVPYSGHQVVDTSWTYPLRDWLMEKAGILTSAAFAIALSLVPGLLPRAPLMQALVTSAFVLIGLGMHNVLRLLPLRVPNFAVRLAAISAVTAALASIWHNWSWQNAARSEMGLETIGVSYWVIAVSVAAAVVTLIVWGMRRGIRAAPSAFHTIPLALVGVVLAYFVSAPFTSYTARADAHGERFMSAAGSAVRVYKGMQASSSPAERARLVVADLDRAGALDRGRLVIAFPTGSGWLDPNAMDAIEARFTGDVAIAAMAYSSQPSWMSYLFGRVDAERAAAALVSEVSRRLAELPAEGRPHLYLYGLSMGAVAGAAALDAVHPDVALCGVVWAGPPPGVDRETPRTDILVNPTDPVPAWTPQLLLRPVDNVNSWMPVVSYVQVGIDLVNSLSAPPGFGHRYGEEQGALLPHC